MFTFLRTDKPFPKMIVAPFTPTSHRWELHLLQFLANSLVVGSYSGECVVVFHCGVNLYFPDD